MSRAATFDPEKDGRHACGPACKLKKVMHAHLTQHHPRTSTARRLPGGPKWPADLMASWQPRRPVLQLQVLSRCRLTCASLQRWPAVSDDTPSCAVLSDLLSLASRCQKYLGFKALLVVVHTITHLTYEHFTVACIDLKVLTAIIPPQLISTELYLREQLPRAGIPSSSRPKISTEHTMRLHTNTQEETVW